jgi:hypothetical protein
MAHSDGGAEARESGQVKSGQVESRQRTTTVMKRRETTATGLSSQSKHSFDSSDSRM